MSFLTDPVQKARGVRIVGEESVNLERVPTVSFVVTGQRPLKSRDIVEVFDKKGGVRSCLSSTLHINIPGSFRLAFVTVISTRSRLSMSCHPS